MGCGFVIGNRGKGNKDFFPGKTIPHKEENWKKKIDVSVWDSSFYSSVLVGWWKSFFCLFADAGRRMNYHVHFTVESLNAPSLAIPPMAVTFLFGLFHRSRLVTCG